MTYQPDMTYTTSAAAADQPGRTTDDGPNTRYLTMQEDSVPHTAEDELRVMQRAFAEAGLTWDPEVPSQEVRRRDEARAEADHLRSALERIVEAYLTHSKPVLERMYVIAIDALRPHEDTDSPTVAEMHASYPPGTFERR